MLGLMGMQGSTRAVWLFDGFLARWGGVQQSTLDHTDSLDATGSGCTMIVLPPI